MTELLIKVQPEVAQEFKEISEKFFKGDDSLTFNQAVRLLHLLQEADHFERFWEIADQLRRTINQAGGLSAKEIERMVEESRKRRRKSLSNS